MKAWHTKSVTEAEENLKVAWEDWDRGEVEGEIPTVDTCLLMGQKRAFFPDHGGCGGGRDDDYWRVDFSSVRSDPSWMVNVCRGQSLEVDWKVIVSSELSN